MDKILLPLKDMIKINSIFNSNIDVLKDKNIIVDKIAFSEKNIPGYDSETDYVVDLCNNYIDTLQNRFSTMSEAVVNIKHKGKSLDTIYNLKNTLPKSYKKLVISSESYFSYNISEEILNKKDRDKFTMVMEGFNSLFDNEGIYSNALKLLSENNFSNLSLQPDEESSIVSAAESYYENLVLNNNYDNKHYTGTEWLNKEVEAFSENMLPKIKNKYNKDIEKLELLGEQLHIILQNYIGRINKWVE